MIECLVYRSATRAYTYLYVQADLAWEDLPEALAAQFKDAEKVMELTLTPDRTLAKENVEQVIANLKDPGYHLQLPPEDDPSGWLDLPEKKS